MSELIILAKMFMRRGEWQLHLIAARWLIDELDHERQAGKQLMYTGLWSQGPDLNEAAGCSFTLIDPPLPADGPIQPLVMDIVDGESRPINPAAAFYARLPDVAYRHSPAGDLMDIQVASWFAQVRGANAEGLYYCPHCGGWIEGRPAKRYIEYSGKLIGRRGDILSCIRCRLELAFRGQLETETDE